MTVRIRPSAHHSAWLLLGAGIAAMTAPAFSFTIMNDDEIAQHTAIMSELKGDAREEYRNAQYELLKKRAAKQGYSMPTSPPWLQAASTPPPAAPEPSPAPVAQPAPPSAPPADGDAAARLAEMRDKMRAHREALLQQAASPPPLPEPSTPTASATLPPATAAAPKQDPAPPQAPAVTPPAMPVFAPPAPPVAETAPKAETVQPPAPSLMEAAPGLPAPIVIEPPAAPEPPTRPAFDIKPPITVQRPQPPEPPQMPTLGQTEPPARPQPAEMPSASDMPPPEPSSDAAANAAAMDAYRQEMRARFEAYMRERQSQMEAMTRQQRDTMAPQRPAAPQMQPGTGPTARPGPYGYPNMPPYGPRYPSAYPGYQTPYWQR